MTLQFLLFPLIIAIPLASLGRFLDEDLLLLSASAGFFSLLYLRAGSAVSDLLRTQVEQIYDSFAELLQLRLARLNLLLTFGLRLLATLSVLSPLLLDLAYVGSFRFGAPAAFPLPMLLLRRSFLRQLANGLTAEHELHSFSEYLIAPLRFAAASTMRLRIPFDHS